MSRILAENNNNNNKKTKSGKLVRDCTVHL